MCYVCVSIILHGLHFCNGEWSEERGDFPHRAALGAGVMLGPPGTTSQGHWDTAGLLHLADFLSSP